MIEILISKKHKHVLLYRYSKKICLEDVEQTDVFFDEHVKHVTCKFDIIADVSGINGFNDKEFLLKAAKLSRKNEPYLNTVCIVGLKKIFHWMYKVYLSITSMYSFKQITIESLEEAEKMYHVNINSDFERVFIYENEHTTV